MRRRDVGPRELLGCLIASWVLIVALAAVALSSVHAAKNMDDSGRLPPEYSQTEE